MILPVIYLSNSLPTEEASRFLQQLLEFGPYTPHKLLLTYDTKSHDFAALYKQELQPVFAEIDTKEFPNQGRNKAFPIVASGRTTPWLWLEPEYTEIRKPNWLQSLDAEWNLKVSEAAGTVFLGTRSEDSKGPIYPLQGVFDSNFWGFSDMVRYLDRAAEEELRWEIKQIFRESSHIGLADGSLLVDLPLIDDV